MKYLSILIFFIILLSGCATDTLPSQTLSQAPSQLDDSIYSNNPYQVIKPQWLYNPDDAGAASAIYSSLPKLEAVGITATTAKEIYGHLPFDRLEYREMRSTAPETPQGSYIHIYPSDLSFALWLDHQKEEAILQVGAEEYYIYDLSKDNFEDIAAQLSGQINEDNRLPPAPIPPEDVSSTPEKKNPSP